MCLGSANLGTARRAAALFTEGVAPRLVVSGGTPWPAGTHATEADAFAAELIHLGVPPAAIVCERRSTNTGENVRLAVEALTAVGVAPRQLVVVCFPTLTRRATATFALIHPDIAVQSLPSFATFDDFEEPPQRAVELVLAELQRLATYPGRGLTAPIDVPGSVLAAAARLVESSAAAHPGDFPYLRSANCAGGA